MASVAAINESVNPAVKLRNVSSTLNSWKEIAVYLGRGVRTVQRWERELRLPVHRIRPTERSPVFAYPNELRMWLESRRNAGLRKLPRCPNGQPIKTSSLNGAETRSRSQRLTEKMCKLLLQQTQYTEELRQKLQTTMRVLYRARAQKSC